MSFDVSVSFLWRMILGSVSKDLKQFLKVAASGGFQGSETVSEGCCFLLGIFRLGLLEVFKDMKQFLKVAASCLGFF